MIKDATNMIKVLKKTFFAITYFTTISMACLLALILVLNFINPAVSQNAQTDQKKNSPGFKEIMGDIKSNLKTIFKESMGKKEDLNQNTKSEAPAPPDIQPEAPVSPDIQPEAPVSPDIQPEAPVSPDIQPEAPVSPDIQPEAPVSPDIQPEAPVSPDIQPEAPVSPDIQPEAPVSPDIQPEAPAPPDIQPEAPAPPDIQPEAPVSPDIQPEAPVSPDIQSEASVLENNSTESSNDFMKDLTGVPSDWIIDIQSSVAPFIYDYETKRDPFDDPSVQKESAGEGLIIIPKTPPEEHDLQEIQLKGITWHTQRPKALFELPNNAGYYTLVKGDKIGKNGVIFEIREDEVVIVETFWIGTGPNKREETKIKIKKLDRLKLLESSKS